MLKHKVLDVAWTSHQLVSTVSLRILGNAAHIESRCCFLVVVPSFTAVAFGCAASILAGSISGPGYQCWLPLLEWLRLAVATVTVAIP